MEASTEVAQAAQLAINLSVAAALLLVLEVIFSNRIFGVFGACSLVGALIMAVKGYGFVIATLFVLAYVTAITLGFLIVIAYFPNLPVSRWFLRRTRARLDREEQDEAEREQAAKEKEAGERGEEMRD